MPSGALSIRYQTVDSTLPALGDLWIEPLDGGLEVEPWIVAGKDSIG